MDEAQIIKALDLAQCEALIKQKKLNKPDHSVVAKYQYGGPFVKL